MSSRHGQSAACRSTYLNPMLTRERKTVSGTAGEPSSAAIKYISGTRDTAFPIPLGVSPVILLAINYAALSASIPALSPSSCLFFCPSLSLLHLSQAWNSPRLEYPSGRSWPRLRDDVSPKISMRMPGQLTYPAIHFSATLRNRALSAGILTLERAPRIPSNLIAFSRTRSHTRAEISQALAIARHATPSPVARTMGRSEGFPREFCVAARESERKELRCSRAVSFRRAWRQLMLCCR